MASAYVDTTWLERSGTDGEAREPSSMDGAADLWPCEERALAAWKAHRVRRWVVRGAGVACMAALCAVFVGVGTSAAARSEIMAWGTMGKVVQPRATAVVAPPATPEHRAVVAAQENGAAPAEIAPAAPLVAAPAVEVPAAPKPVVVAMPSRARMRAAAPPSARSTDDANAAASKAVAPREEKDDDADPYR